MRIKTYIIHTDQQKYTLTRQHLHRPSWFSHGDIYIQYTCFEFQEPFELGHAPRLTTSKQHVHHHHPYLLTYNLQHGCSYIYMYKLKEYYLSCPCLCPPKKGTQLSDNIMALAICTKEYHLSCTCFCPPKKGTLLSDNIMKFRPYIYSPYSPLAFVYLISNNKHKANNSPFIQYILYILYIYIDHIYPWPSPTAQGLLKLLGFFLFSFFYSILNLAWHVPTNTNFQKLQLASYIIQCHMCVHACVN